MRYIKIMLAVLAVLLISASLIGCGSNPGGGTPDTTAPTVVSTSPTNEASNVPVNRKIIASFSEAMSPSTITATTVTLWDVDGGPASVECAVSYAATSAILSPEALLTNSHTYVATVFATAKDLAGNPLAADKTWIFTAGSASDTTAPTVASLVPTKDAVGVPTNANAAAIFSEPMDPATMTTTNVSLLRGLTPVSCTLTYIGNTITLNPGSNLQPLTIYTVVIKGGATGVKDLADNPLAADKVWSFTTGTGPAPNRQPVDLGAAGNYVILSKSGIDTVPTSVITGDIAVSPIGAGAITGFSLTAVGPTDTYSTSTQVIGKVYTPDYAAPTPGNLTVAVSNMETAYTDASTRTLPDFTELGAGEIGGLTLVPGLYKWGTDVDISTDVYLNGQGNSNAVWIFQISGGLTLANGIAVHLINGAQAKNVFWQTFGAVYIGTTAHFEGIVLCQTNIAAKTRAVIIGKLYAQTAVTLQANTVTQP